MNKKWYHKKSILIACNSSLIIIAFCIIGLGAIVYATPYSPFILKYRSLLIGVVSSLLSAAVINLLWEIRSKETFYEEIEKNFSDRIESVVNDVKVLKLVHNDGLNNIATDFHNEIEWKRYIESSTEIDICWWSGRSWIKGNKTVLNEFIKKGGSIRIIIPDITNSDILEQMCRDSGLNENQLDLAQREAIGLLKEFGSDSVLVGFMPRVPRYMYIRMGNTICVTAYSLNQGTFTDSVTLVLEANKPIANIFTGDYGKLKKIVQMKTVLHL